MDFDEKELAAIWFSLLLERNRYEKGSQKWFFYDRLIRRIEPELGMTERPVVEDVTNAG